MKTLVFIDTNIFLDFYRARGKESGLSMLKHVDDAHAKIITSVQVEMEFKKNRQKAILDVLNGLKTPEWNSLTLPAVLRDADPHKAIQTAKEGIEAAQAQMRVRLDNWLRAPKQNDVVYQCAQRLFMSSTPTNLKSDAPELPELQRLAHSRFLRGYPPRKSSDSSYGDAINWEWILACAHRESAKVVIVSRDSDFGIKHSGDYVVNDWLAQEFSESVGANRSVTMTSRLADALKRAAVSVSKADEKEEEAFIARLPEVEESTQAGLPPFHQWLQFGAHFKEHENAQEQRALLSYLRKFLEHPADVNLEHGQGKDDETK